MSEYAKYGQLVYLVQADVFAQSALRQQCAKESIYYRHSSNDKTAVSWEQLGGVRPIVATVGERPICLRIMYYRLAGQLVGFWHATSGLVDYDLITQWFSQQFKAVPRCDADNFNLCLHHVRDLRVQAQRAGRKALRRVAPPLRPGHGAEVLQVFCLSTCHVLPGDGELMTQRQRGGFGDYTANDPWRGGFEEGAWFWAGAQWQSDTPWSEAVWTVLNWAINFGAQYVVFDRDGPEVEQLQKFDW